MSGTAYTVSELVGEIDETDVASLECAGDILQDLGFKHAANNVERALWLLKTLRLARDGEDGG